MNYNSNFISDEINQRLNKRINSLLIVQEQVLDFIKKLLLSSNGKEQRQHCECFLHLFVKIRLNLEVANNILSMLLEDYRFKTSLNVVYRSIVDDVINGRYLAGTVILDDPEQVALKNELNILHKEFLMATIKADLAEREFRKVIGHDDIQFPEMAKVNEGIQTANPELMDANFKWKKNSEIRETTHSYFKERFDPKTNSSSFISEAAKLKFIANRGVITHHNLETLFKYLSQFQHYSPKMHQFNLSDAELDVSHYERCLGEVVLLMDYCFDILELSDKEMLQEEWKLLADKVFDSFQEK